MNKYKIVALFGKAGAGKDYIQKQIMQTDFGKNYLSEIISCTTRLPREDEIDGVHYHFIPSFMDFLKKDLIEFTCFQDWWYGTSINDLNKNKINIGVFNIDGISKIINTEYQNSRIDCLPIRIHCYDKLRLIRQLNRENNPNCLEICRRFQADYKDFSNIPFEYKGIINDTNEVIPILKEIEEIIKDKWSI